MSYEERKQQREERRYRKRKRQRIFLICFFALLLIRFVSMVLAKHARTTLPEEYALVKGKEVQGVLIMEETLYTTVENTKFKDKDLEGKRLPAGYKVADVSLLSDVSSLKEELKQVEEAIDVLSKSDKENEIVEKDKDEIKKDQKNLIDILKDGISSGDFSHVKDIKDALFKKGDKIEEISPTNTLLTQSLENLENKREDLLDEINKNNMTYSNTIAGMLSYKIDGYEKLYIPKEFENYTYEKLDIPDNIDKKDKEKFNGFKIINNFEWYIALKIDDAKEIKTYEVGDSINLEFLEDEEVSRGTVVAVNSSKEKMVLVVKLTTNLDKYYEERFPKVSIIMLKQDVYKLPTKALVDKDGQMGVYIKEFSGIVRFRPLSIIESNKDYTYVDMGDARGYIEISGNKDPVRTITLYDEIFVNPINIKEGQILD